MLRDDISKETDFFFIDWTISDGCKELLNWFKKYSLNENEIHSKKFIRIKQLKYLIEKNKISENLIWNSAANE